MSYRTDAELLACFCRERDGGEGDDAFAEIARRYVNLVHGAAMRQVRCGDLANDVTQAVFIVLARKAAKVRAESLAAWLLSATRLCARDCLRKQQRREKYEKRAAAMRSEQVSGDLGIDEDITANLDEAMARLRPRESAAVAMRYLQERPLAEVAAAMGVSVHATQKVLARSLPKMRRFLAARGVTLASEVGIAGVMTEASKHAAPQSLVASISHRGADIGANAAALADGAARMLWWIKAKTMIASSAIVLVIASGIVAAVAVSRSAKASNPAPVQPVAASGNGLASRVKTVYFRERSPLSAIDEVSNREKIYNWRDKTPSELAKGEYDLATTPYSVYVPPGYNARTPYGLYVWMGVSEASPEWLDVLARHRLIFITTHKIWTGQAMDAVYNMQREFNIDPNRIYVSGFSAGGGLATWTMRMYPEVFTGGVFLMGGYFYHSVGDEKKPKERREPTVMPNEPTWYGPVDPALKKRMKIVIVRGDDDQSTWWSSEGQSDLEALTLDGFLHVNFIRIPRWGHVHPDTFWFDKAITAIDSPGRASPPATGPTQDAHPQPGQVAQAKRLLATAQFYMPEEVGLRARPKAFQESVRIGNFKKARPYLIQVLEGYPTTPSAQAAKELLAKIDDILSKDAAKLSATTTTTTRASGK